MGQPHARHRVIASGSISARPAASLMRISLLPQPEQRSLPTAVRRNSSRAVDRAGTPAIRRRWSPAGRTGDIPPEYSRTPSCAPSWEESAPAAIIGQGAFARPVFHARRPGGWPATPKRGPPGKYRALNGEAGVAFCLAFEKLGRDRVEVVWDAAPMASCTASTEPADGRPRAPPATGERGAPTNPLPRPASARSSPP